MGVLRWLQNNTQIVVVFFFLTAGFFNWLVRTLAKQAMEKKARDRQQRAEAEALRTGRPAAMQSVTTQEMTAARRLEELAERRRQQLEELRRRAAAKAGMGAGGGQVAQQIARTPRPAPPRTATSAPEHARAAQPQRQAPQPPARRAGPINPQEATARAATRQASDLETRRVQDALARRDAERQRLAAEQRVTQAAKVESQLRTSQAAAVSRREAAEEDKRQSYDNEPRAQATGSVRLSGVSEWRRAMVLREVLGPPVSLREEGGGALGELV